MSNRRDEVVYRFELLDGTKLTENFQLGQVVPSEGEPVIVPGVPRDFEVAGFRWNLPANAIPRQPVVGVVVVRECAVQFPILDNDPFDGDPDGGDPRDRR